MNVLLFHPDKKTLDRIEFCLESQMSLNVSSSGTFQEALEFLLGDGAIDLILTNFQPETDKLFKYLLSSNANIPVILINNGPQKNVEAYPDIHILGQLSQDEATEKLLPMIQQHFKDIQSSQSQSEYCRIATELLTEVVPLRSDIYIRLSNVKYVKLFRSGSTFTKDDLQKFLFKRQVKHLYVKKTETKEFIQKFKADLSKWLNEATAGDPGLLNTVSEVHELIQELSSRLGFTEEVQELARRNIQLTIKSIGHNPQLIDALKNSQMKSRNYVSSHSVLLANISCSIAAQMEWPSNSTFQKLVLASLFHDFSFQNPELAKLTSKKQMENIQKNISPEEYDVLIHHPQLAAQAIQSFSDLPGEVDFLILQHHERPDGSGFPTGMKGAQIAPLAAVFIVAHDIIDHMTQMGSGFSLPHFLQSMEAHYATGTFRQIWKVLSSHSNGNTDGDQNETKSETAA